MTRPDLITRILTVVWFVLATTVITLGGGILFGVMLMAVGQTGGFSDSGDAWASAAACGLAALIAWLSTFVRLPARLALSATTVAVFASGYLALIVPPTPASVTVAFGAPAAIVVIVSLQRAWMRRLFGGPC